LQAVVVEAAVKILVGKDLAAAVEPVVIEHQ
jgi:hypothetical protein